MASRRLQRCKSWGKPGRAAHLHGHTQEFFPHILGARPHLNLLETASSAAHPGKSLSPSRHAGMMHRFPRRLSRWAWRASCIAEWLGAFLLVIDAHQRASATRHHRRRRALLGFRRRPLCLTECVSYVDNGGARFAFRGFSKSVQLTTLCLLFSTAGETYTTVAWSARVFSASKRQTCLAVPGSLSDGHCEHFLERWTPLRRRCPSCLLAIQSA